MDKSDFEERSHIYWGNQQINCRKGDDERVGRAFTEWSIEADNTRQDGNGPKPQAISVIGRVWSDKFA